LSPRTPSAQPLVQELDLDKRADDAVLQLQRLLFRHWPALRDIALTNCASARSRAVLAPALAPCGHSDLFTLAVTQLRLANGADADTADPDFLREVILSHFEAAPRQRAAIAAMPLFPTEALLWDTNQIPSISYCGEECLALPKLNLQFLTFWDYLLRNFNLFRLEAAYEIREDVGDVLKVRSLGGGFWLADFRLGQCLMNKAVRIPGHVTFFHHA
jgi:intron-binding protein aquarius